MPSWFHAMQVDATAESIVGHAAVESILVNLQWYPQKAIWTKRWDGLVFKRYFALETLTIIRDTYHLLSLNGEIIIFYEDWEINKDFTNLLTSK